jgi:uncharacterized protein YecT (DUF1311 family)
MAAIGALAGLDAPALAAGAGKADAYYSATYKSCMNGAMSSLAMRDCQTAEYDAWDKTLNRVYQALMSSRPAAAQTQLRDDERAWLARTKQTCEHAGDGEAGGSLQPIEIQGCYLDQHILRAVYLRGLH